MYSRSRSALRIVGLDLPDFQSSHRPQLAFSASRKSL